MMGGKLSLSSIWYKKHLKMNLITVLTSDLKWTTDRFTGRKGLSASDRSVLEAQKGGKVIADLIYFLHNRPDK